MLERPLLLGAVKLAEVIDAFIGGTGPAVTSRIRGHKENNQAIRSDGDEDHGEHVLNLHGNCNRN
jgi:hypothetical protein